MNNLIYTTIGYDVKWFNVIKLLLKSLSKCSSPYTFDFLIICDNNLYTHINNHIKTNSYNGLNIKLYCLPFNSSRPDIASINKLRVFDWSEIDSYNKIMFVDGDILCNTNMNTFFNNKMEDNILYVYKECDTMDKHENLYWGLQNYTREELETFALYQIYPFNCGLFLFNNTNEMKDDFHNILNMIETYEKEYFYEQSFMNYYFNKKRNVNYTIFTKDNYKLFPDLHTEYDNMIIHFTGASDVNKLTKIENYYNSYFVQKFDNRKDMLSFYINKLDNPVISEIGVFRGEFLDYIYSHPNISSIDAIDLFEGTTCSGNADGNYVVYYDMNKSYNELLEKYNNTNVKLHKSDSSTFLNNVPDNYYDIIYIDGDHSYEGAKKDLHSAYKKIKPNGYIMGHDYEMNMNKAKTYYNFGVKYAVDDFCKIYDQQLDAKANDGCVSFCIQVNK